jgi:hypothetical protein
MGETLDLAKAMKARGMPAGFCGPRLWHSQEGRLLIANVAYTEGDHILHRFFFRSLDCTEYKEFPYSKEGRFSYKDCVVATDRPVVYFNQ